MNERERPILFNAEMARAILEGRKTQSRRVIDDRYQMCRSPEDEPEWFIENCKYGKVGDRLWVREPWKLVGWQWDEPEQKIMFCNESKWVDSSRFDEFGLGYQEFDNWLLREYERVVAHPSTKVVADETFEDGKGYKTDDQALPWRPGMFMPRWASRITLEITGVLPQRLQDVTYGDCVAEGVEMGDYKPGWDVTPYASLWDSINAKRGHSWASNPWVWAIEFCRSE